MIDKHKLPNGNVFMYVSSPTDGETKNMLLLSGGDLLFFDEKARLPLWKEEVKSDLTGMGFDNPREFVDKYDLPNPTSDLWKDLAIGIERGRYPAHSAGNNDLHEYERAFKSHLSRAVQVGQDEGEKKKVIDRAREECRRLEREIQ